MLETKIGMIYCSQSKTWYWSADGIHWQLVGCFLVQNGDLKGHRPRDEDVKALQTIIENTVEKKIASSRCLICK